MKDKLIRSFKIAPITMGIIVICVMTYIISFILFGETMNVYEGLFFGGYNPVIVHEYHEYYRLLTANFIHFGIMHIAVNCYSLYGIGMFIERSLKTRKYLIVLLISALSTTGLPYLLYLLNGFEANTVSGGVSGVIFGLIGSLGALAVYYKNIFMSIFKQLSTNLILMLVISFLVPSISLSGHICGFIGGFVATYMIIYFTHKKNTNQHLVN